jgi:DNA (cytosine-5)-methyltransferase 1
LRAATIIRPDYIIGENVKGLLNRIDKNGELYIEVIKREFEAIGYAIEYKLIKMDKYGVPQKRERLIILGVQTGLLSQSIRPIIKFPLENTGPTPNLIPIIKFDMRGSIFITKDTIDYDKIPGECIVSDMENDDISGTYPVHPYLISKIQDDKKEYLGKKWSTLFSFGKRDSPIHCEIIDIRKPSKTIICSYEHQPRLFVLMRNKRGHFLRCLLPDELKQIQGFPIDYKITGNLKQQIIQIGNAVPSTFIAQLLSI